MKDRTLFMTGAVLFALSLRGLPMPASLLLPGTLVQILQLAVIGVASWRRQFRLAWGTAFGLAALQAGLPWWQMYRAGLDATSMLLPIALWGLVLAVNARKERREVYFS
jgi:hypothetical protein